MRRLVPLFAFAGAALAGCGGGGGDPAPNTLPAGVTQHSVTHYTATAPAAGTTAATQDLLTGGLGTTGLRAAAAPAYADPNNPTVLELRRNALHSNYRAILDPTDAGGYSRLYGPNVTADGTVTASEGLIRGREYIGSLDDGTGRKRVVMAVQIPDSFNPDRPCLVLGPSSGSRGVYGAIGTAGEWGLKRGCAVALTDAGKGVGLHDLGDDTVNRIDGTRATRTAAGALAHFAANITETARATFNTLLPNRFAIKQVHSQQNPEKDWGSDTLAAARYAFYAINDVHGTAERPVRVTPATTLVIAGSASNGGAAVLRAGEEDTQGLIDGVVAAEPVTQMPTTSGYGIAFNGSFVSGFGRTLADMVTYGNLYQPCAQLAPDATLGAEASLYNWMVATGMNTRAEARCTSLAAYGLVTGATTAERAADALNRLKAYGWTAEHDTMHNSYWGLGNGPILSAMYPVAYGRFSVIDNVCSTSFAAADVAGSPRAATPAEKASSFAVANGTANGQPVGVVYDASQGGPKTWQFAVSPTSGTADFGLDTALCQRSLVTGVLPDGAPLTASTTPTAAQSAAVRAGIAEVTLDGDLRGKPTIIVHGRSDALVPVNNNSRAYVALNRAVEGTASRVRYVEVTNAQHFDTFIPFSGFDTRFVPLHVYFNQAMDMMWEHLRFGTNLPPNQVVRTTPRGGVPGAAPALTSANVPPIRTIVPAGDQIGFSGATLTVPQ